MVKQFMSRLERLYPDQNDLRRARALVLTLAGLALGTLLYIFLFLPLAANTPLLLVLLVPGFLGTAAVVGFSLWFLLERRLQLATWLQAAGYWLIASVAILLPGGVTSGAVAGMLLLYIVLSAIFLTRRETLILIAAYIVSILIVSALQLNASGSLIVPASISKLLQHGSALIFGILLTGLIVSGVMRQFASTVTVSEQRAQRLEAMLQVSEAAKSSLDLDEMLSTVVRRVAAEFGYQHVKIIVLDEKGFDATAYSSLQTGDDIEPTQLAVNAYSIVGQVIQRQKPIVMAPTDSKSKVAVAQAMLPMMSADRMIGVLEAQSASADALDDAEISMLHTLANQLALAIQNAQTFASESALLEATSPMYRATRELGTATSPASIIEVLKDHVVFDADRISLVQAGFGVSGETIIKQVNTWDRDDIGSKHEFPLKLHQAVIGREALIVPDVNNASSVDVYIKEFITEDLQATALALFPLRGTDMTVGSLAIAHRKPREYTMRETHTLQVLSGQIAHMLETAIILDALSRQTERLSMANTLSHDISGTLEMRMLGELLTDRLQQILTFDHLSIVLYEQGRVHARIETLHGQAVELMPDLPRTPIAYAIQRERSIQVQDDTEWPDRHLWNAAGIESLLVAPLIIRGKTLGTLNIGVNRAYTFEPDDIMLAEQMAVQTAAAIENMRLFERMQSSLQESTALYSTSLAMNAAQNLVEVYETTILEIAQLSNAQIIELYLAGPDPRLKLEYIEQVAVLRDEQLETQGEKLRYAVVEAPVLSQFPQSRANLVFNDLQSDQRIDEEVRTQYVNDGVNAMVLIPVSTGTIWLGALLLKRTDANSFVGEQVRLCRNIADQAALAIDSHFLLERTQRTAIHEQALREISEQLRDETDIESMLSIAQEKLSRALNLTPEQLGAIDWDNTLALTPDEWDLVRAVGIQVDLAIANLSLLKETEQRARHEQMVGEVATELQRTTNVDEVMETAVRTLQNVLSDYNFSVRLTQPNDGHSSGAEMPENDTTDE